MKVHSQRDAKSADLRGHGCGAYAALAAWAWASDGKVSPDHDSVAEDEARAAVIRSGATWADFRKRGLRPDEVEKAYAARRRIDRPAPPSQRRRGVKVREQLIPQLATGLGALVPVDYGAVQDGGKGVGSFRGGHWVFVFDPAGDSIKVADPLRRSVTTWPIALLVKAMERFGAKPWGNGRGEAIVVHPWPTYRDLMLRARGQRDAAKARVAELEALADGTALERLRSVAKTVAGNLEEQVDILDAAVAA